MPGAAARQHPAPSNEDLIVRATDNRIVVSRAVSTMPWGEVIGQPFIINEQPPKT